MWNFKQFFEKIAYPILKKMCFLQQKNDKIAHVSLSKTYVIRSKC